MRFPWTTADLIELPTVGTPVASAKGLFDRSLSPGAQLAAIRAHAETFRRELASTGVPDSVTTCELVTLPYPTRFGLFRASRSPAPFLAITNRMLVIRWREGARVRTLLFEPSDVELGRATPYFLALAQRTPSFLAKRMATVHGTVLDHLARLGIAPEAVDYLLFDHLHTQDLRRWVGTTTPQADLGGQPRAIFPNAKVIVQRDELAAIADLHPLQQPWYQPATYCDLPREALLAVDGAVLLGPGVAIIKTPGHVSGNQSLVLNTSTGIWVSSENVIAAECLVPEHSRLPGVAAWARAWHQDLILNANTLEAAADQYNSAMLEKLLCDPSQADSRFPQFFPSSELTAAWTNPGTAPTFTHRAITHDAR
jgi:glyoxylase-like metal-dependent hydrolase (beta-lactamase superfamily II)